MSEQIDELQTAAPIDEATSEPVTEQDLPLSQSAKDEAEEAADDAREPASVRDLEEEGDVAADYLEEFLDIIDVDGDIDIDVEKDRASLAIVTESTDDRDLRQLVGQGGEVLEALQELTRLAVQVSTGHRSRLMLDIAGHREQQRRRVSEIAREACAKVRDGARSYPLEPMSAFERKIVHDVVAAAGLRSESEGADRSRHVVVFPH